MPKDASKITAPGMPRPHVTRPTTSSLAPSLQQTWRPRDGVKRRVRPVLAQHLSLHVAHGAYPWELRQSH